MDTASNLLALLVCAIAGGGILGCGLAFGLRVSGDSGWPILPLGIIGFIAFATTVFHFKG